MKGNLQLPMAFGLRSQTLDTPLVPTQAVAFGVKPLVVVGIYPEPWSGPMRHHFQPPMFLSLETGAISPMLALSSLAYSQAIAWQYANGGEDYDENYWGPTQ